MMLLADAIAEVLLLWAEPLMFSNGRTAIESSPDLPSLGTASGGGSPHGHPLRIERSRCRGMRC